MAATENYTSATPTTKSGVTEIEVAATAHTREFAAYVAFGIIAAIVLAFLTWRVWKAGNRVQEAITRDATTRIEEAKKGVAEANMEIARLTAETARLNKDSQVLQSDVAKARRESEQDRLERLKLEAQVAPRRLNVEQQKAITASLKGFNGRAVRLATYQFDVDAGILATQVKPALQQAGILVEDGISRVFLIGGFAVGIHIAGPATEQDLVKALTDSLVRDGKLAASNTGTKQPPGVVGTDKVTVLIGPKPLSESTK